jgi:adenylyltransferase/sulfurtransferase
MSLFCAEAGVTGVLPAVIGLLQANESIRLLLGIGDPWWEEWQCFDALHGDFSALALERDPACRYGGDRRPFPG